MVLCCSFDLEVLGGDITLLPGLEAWLNSFIRASVLRCGICTSLNLDLSFTCLHMLTVLAHATSAAILKL